MRPAVAIGQAYSAENKPAEALAKFDWVLAQKAGDSELAEYQRQTAILGKARCLAITNQADAAIRAVQTVIAKAAKADPDNATLLGPAYNALGFAYQKAGRPLDAIFAYLHVNTQYASNGEAHAEALYHLVQLFTETGKRDRAKDCKTALQQQYKDSRWNNMEK